MWCVEDFALNPYFMPGAVGGMFTLYVVVLMSNIERVNTMPQGEAPSINQVFCWTIAAGVVAILGLNERSLEQENEWIDAGGDLLAIFVVVALGYGHSMITLLNAILKAPSDPEHSSVASERVRSRLRRMRKPQ